MKLKNHYILVMVKQYFSTFSVNVIFLSKEKVVFVFKVYKRNVRKIMMISKNTRHTQTHPGPRHPYAGKMFYNIQHVMYCIIHVCICLILLVTKRLNHFFYEKVHKHKCKKISFTMVTLFFDAKCRFICGQEWCVA